MNFLGHWLFSEPTPDALIGSLWPDFAKRPDPQDVSDTFLVHFDRHQWLDRTTDTSTLLEPLRQALRPRLRKTTPIVVDMLIDHHLARHWQRYHSEPLAPFAGRRYSISRQFNRQALPERLSRTLDFMSEQDWLTGYRDEKNILRALQGLSRRIRFQDSMVENGLWSLKQLEKHREEVSRFIEQCLIYLPNIEQER